MTRNNPLDRLKKDLPKFQEEPAWQEKIEEEKKSFLALSVTELARQFARTRAVKKDYEAQVKGCNLELEALSQLLVESLEGQELKSVNLTTGETVYLQSDVYPSTTDRDKLRVWALEDGQAELLTINYQTLAGLVKSRLIDGKEPPPGVAVTLRTRARCRGGNVED